VLALSTSVIFIKASTTHPVLIAAIRLTIATLLLTPLERRDRHRHAVILAAQSQTPSRTWIAGVILAFHFISWNYGARMTVSAQASLIVNLVPVAVPFFLWFLASEQINRREIIGTLVTLAGVLLLTISDVVTSTGSATGNLVCFISMLLFACYLALGRRNRHLPSIWLYVVPVYRSAAITCAIISIPLLSTGMRWSSPIEWAYLFALAIVPTIVGHSLLNGAMRHFRGQVVSLANSAQFVAAGVLAWLIFNETPSSVFYIASVIVVAGIAIVIRTPRSVVRPK
jgi:drug/metabolite transporter (DMT)-like permease